MHEVEFELGGGDGGVFHSLRQSACSLFGRGSNSFQVSGKSYREGSSSALVFSIS